MQQYWQELYADRTVQRDNNGFRGAEQLWIPAHHLKMKKREHFLLESSDSVEAPILEQRKAFRNHLSRQDHSFDGAHFKIDEAQSADASKGPDKTPAGKRKAEDNETPEKVTPTVNLQRERPALLVEEDSERLQQRLASVHLRSEATSRIP